MGDLDHATRDIYKYFVNGPFGCRKAMQLALGGFDHRQQKLKSGAHGGGHAPDIFHFFFFFLISKTAVRHLNGTICV